MNNSFGRAFRSTPPVTLNLIIINVIVWLAEMLTGSFGNRLVDLLGLHYWGASDFNPIQIVTYMFLHDNHSFVHIFFNMFTLWMFGRTLEQVWGSRRFLLFYFICGIGAAIVQEAVWSLTYLPDYIDAIAHQNGLTNEQIRVMMASDPASFADGIAAFKNMMITIGASGAVFGLLLGFAFVFPNLPLYLFFIPIPIKAKYMVIGYAVLEFFLGITPTVGGAIAHFAHLGGMLFGLVILLIWKKQGKLGGRIF